MARNTAGRAGFTPENLTAGLDLNIDDKENKTLPKKKETPSKDNKIENTSNEVVENKKNKRSSKKQNASKEPEVKLESNELVNRTPEPTPIPSSSEPSSLDDLLNTVEYDKKQENIYLPPETRDPLQAVGKLIGKKNGGKSTVVHMALLDFFKNNPDTVKKALEKYGKE